MSVVLCPWLMVRNSCCLLMMLCLLMMSRFLMMPCLLMISTSTPLDSSPEAEANEGDDKDIGTSGESVPKVQRRSATFSLGGAVTRRESSGQTTGPSVPSGAGHAQGDNVGGYGGAGDAERNTAAPKLLRASSSSYPAFETPESSTPLLKAKAPSKVCCVVLDVWGTIRFAISAER